MPSRANAASRMKSEYPQQKLNVM